MTDPRLVASEIRCDLGEGPLWDPARGNLYVTDAFVGTVRVLDRKLRVLETIETGRTTTAITRQSDGSVLLFHDRGAITRRTPSGTSEVLLEYLPDEREGLFNDVIADPEGRVFAGAQPVGSRPGRLYCIERDLSHRVLVDDLGEPNGLGFSPDCKALYFNDSGTQTIWRFAYDRKTGSLSDREVFLKTSGALLPDGLTVDADGFIWTAFWNGSCVVRIDPDARIVESVSLPAQRITSLTFGDSTLDTLYITSAQFGAKDEDAKSPFDGAVFAIEKCGKGLPEYPSRLGMP